MDSHSGNRLKDGKKTCRSRFKSLFQSVHVMEVAANQAANQIFTVIPLFYWFPFG